MTSFVEACEHTNSSGRIVIRGLLSSKSAWECTGDAELLVIVDGIHEDTFVGSLP